MPTVSHSRAEHHYDQAEKTLALLGSLGASEEEATRESLVAVCHAILSVAATLIERGY